jgi:hypothetical protein
MLVGSESQIAARLAAIGTENPTLAREMSSSEQSLMVEMGAEGDSPIPAEVIQLQEVPSVPDDLSPGQKAQLCEILDYLQSRIHRLIETAKTDENGQDVSLKLSAWQRLLDTQARLAKMTRQIADPDWPNE